MKGLNPNPENGKRNGVIGLGLGTEHGAPAINVKVSHGDVDHEVTVPSNSSFGDLKSCIAQKIGLNLESYKILFRGKEKEDDEDLETAGVKENSKVLLVECMSGQQENPEEVKETSVISRGCEAVAEVRKEVDKFSEQVLALQAVVDGGTKVDDKNIIYVTEMLMRQLLKLDGIEAEGEGKVQRKIEVRRVQSLVETMDALKSKNSNPSSNVDNAASLSTKWESFEPSSVDANASSPMPSSAPGPSLSSAPCPAPAPAPAPAPSSAPNPIPSPSHVPFSSPSHVPPYDSTPMSSYDPSQLPSYAPSMPSYSSPLPSYGTAPIPSYDTFSYAPSPMPSYGHSYYPAPTTQDYSHSSHASYPHVPSHTPYPGQSHINYYPPQFYSAHPSHSYAPHPNPYHDPSSMTYHAPDPNAVHVPLPGQSSTKITQDWERFE